jgi:hypothetical protein
MSLVKHFARDLSIRAASAVRIDLLSDRAEEGTEHKDVGDQALIRGSTPHCRLFVRGCLCLGSGVDLADRPHTLPEGSPTVAPSPPLHECCRLPWFLLLSCSVLLQGLASAVRCRGSGARHHTMDGPDEAT